MSGVDVMTVLERIARNMDALSLLDQANSLRKCHSELAELIDCVGDAQSLLAEIDAAVRKEHAKNGAPQSKSVAGIINERLTAALARVGGAA